MDYDTYKDLEQDLAEAVAWAEDVVFSTDREGNHLRPRTELVTAPVGRSLLRQFGRGDYWFSQWKGKEMFSFWQAMYDYVKLLYADGEVTKEDYEYYKEKYYEACAAQKDLQR